MSSKLLLLDHLSGVSFRSLGEKYNVNASTVYRKCLSELNKLPHCADITRKYCTRFCGTLLVDDKYVSVKGYDRKIPVLYAIDYLTHDIPTYILSLSESYQTCRSFFASLRLLNYPLQACVSDDNTNIFQAGKSVYPNAVTQLCQNHFKQSLRLGLNVRSDPTYRPFMTEIEILFKHKRSIQDFTGLAGKIVRKYSANSTCVGAMTEIQRRLPELTTYTNIPHVPTTNNLIESYNSHLEGRLKTIKGFRSFKHADTWLNAYFMRRKLKKFTDCQGRFRSLNGKCSLEQSLNSPHEIKNLLKLIR
jgi:transposase-like protein